MSSVIILTSILDSLRLVRSFPRNQYRTIFSLALAEPLPDIKVSKQYKFLSQNNNISEQINHLLPECVKVLLVISNHQYVTLAVVR